MFLNSHCGGDIIIPIIPILLGRIQTLTLVAPEQQQWDSEPGLPDPRALTQLVPYSVSFSFAYNAT